MTDEPWRSDAEIEEEAARVCAQACVEALSPTDPIQVEANVLALEGALNGWSTTDLKRLVICLASVAAHCSRALQEKQGNG